MPDDLGENDFNRTLPEYQGLLEAEQSRDEPSALKQMLELGATIALFWWLTKEARYIRIAGDLVESISVDSILAQRTQESMRRLTRNNDLLLNETINEAEWYKRSEQEILNLHTQAFRLANGGKLNQMERDRLQELLRFQRYRLRQFRSELNQLSPAQIRSRLRMYATSARATFEMGRQSAALRAGFTQGWRRLSPVHEHCASCPRHQTMGWVGIDQIVPPGMMCECGPNCKCTVEYR